VHPAHILAVTIPSNLNTLNPNQNQNLAMGIALAFIAFLVVMAGRAVFR
jgi:hypothetical protein